MADRLQSGARSAPSLLVGAVGGRKHRRRQLIVASHRGWRLVSVTFGMPCGFLGVPAFGDRLDAPALVEVVIPFGVTPRIHRIRWDKPVEEADRLEALERLMEG